MKIYAVNAVASGLLTRPAAAPECARTIGSSLMYGRGQLQGPDPRRARRSRGGRLRSAAGRVVGVVALLLASVAALSAQSVSTAGIRGTVTDTAGSPIATAEVVLSDTATGRSARTLTNGEGRYVIPSFAPGGPYVLTVSALGWGTAERRNVYLEIGQSRVVDITLTDQPVALDAIEVSTARDLVFSPSRTGAATVIEERAIRTLPNIERDFIRFAELSPLVSIDEEAISIAGQNNLYNNIQIDGALNQDVFGLSPSGVPGGLANAKALPIEAVRQYRVLVAPFDVRHSGFVGGLLNAVTKAGTNEWSATGFAYYRDGDFLGSTEVDGAAVSDFSTQLAGFTIGGPIVRDRLHMFVAGEFERRNRPTPGFSLGVADTIRLGVHPDSLARLSSILQDRYAVDAGTAEEFTLENPLSNVFARLDYRVGDRHNLTLRHNYVGAENDVAVNRFSFDAFEYSSNGSRFESGTHSTMVQLNSRLTDDISMEALVSYQRTRDASRPRSRFPQVEVDVTSDLGGSELSRRVRVGADVLSQANELAQDIVQVSDNLSRSVGAHLFTLGVDGQYTRVEHLLVPSFLGAYRFDDLASLETNRPSSFDRTLLRDGVEPAIEFSTLQLAAYGQDEWSVTDDLTLTFGLRLDMPVSLSTPEFNRDVLVDFGIANDRLPTRNVLFSPRVGINWSFPGRYETQLRGGVGLFTGRPPFVWLANAFANSGMRTRLLTCEGGSTPAFEPLERSPTQCLSSQGAGEDRSVVVFDEQFHYPQDFKTSVAVDQELPWGVVATFEALYTKAIHQVALQDLNLGRRVMGTDTLGGFDERFGDRDYFGQPIVEGTFGAYLPNRVVDTYDHVIRVGNVGKNSTFAASIELQRRFSERLDLRGAYTFTRSVDVRSLQYPDATLNYGLTPIRADPDRPELSYSAWDRPHKVLLSAWSRLLDWGDGLDLTLLYIGQSGRPYSYVYESDLNGDGYPGPGAAADAYNDLLYVPINFSDLSGTVATRVLTLQLRELDPCLGRSAGGIIPRNFCRTPWTNQLDMRLSQGLRLGGSTLRIEADLINVLNLVNQEWGLVEIAPPLVPVMRGYDRPCVDPPVCLSPEGPIIMTYSGPRRTGAEGGVAADVPYALSLPDSQWRAQIGLRWSF